mgnify:CR=1 FL=1
MSNKTLEEALMAYSDPIDALRDSSVVDNPTPDGRPRPREFTNWMDEQLSWKETCYLGDWSFMPDLHVDGPDALDLFRDLSVNTFDDFEVGKAKHAVQCTEAGNVIGDGILYRTGPDSYRTQHLAAWPQFNAEKHGYDVTADIHDTFIYQLQGPTSLAVLEAVTDDTVRDIDFMYIEEVDIGGADEETIRQRCEILHRAGFVEREFGDNYEISKWGALYLDGEVSARAREPLPAPRPPEAVRPGWYAGFG